MIQNNIHLRSNIILITIFILIIIVEFFKTFIRMQTGFVSTGVTVLTDEYYFLFVNNYR